MKLGFVSGSKTEVETKPSQIKHYVMSLPKLIEQDWINIRIA